MTNIAVMKSIALIFLSLTVMFWNVENFFDPFDDPEKEDETFTPAGDNRWTWQRFLKKRNDIAKTVISVGDVFETSPALIGLCEVENRMVLRQLITKSPLAEDDEYGFIHRESPDRRGIDVALLYKKDIFRPVLTDSLRIDEFATRDILYVKGILYGISPFRTGDTLHIFINHWPSKLGGASQTSGRREAVTSCLVRFLDSLLAESAEKDILIMGDFNETEPSITTPGISRLCPRKGLGNGFYPPGTLKYKGKWEQIDHYFISSPLTRFNVEETIYAPAFLLEEDKAFLGRKPRRTYVGPRYKGGISDHLPIILTIR